MSEFFEMGGYAAFVWPSYVVTVAVLLGLGLGARAALKKQEKALDDLNRREDSST